MTSKKKKKNKYKLIDHGNGITEEKLENGTIQWSLNGKLHRENEPAVITSEGHEEWWLKGFRHREGGPAFTGANHKEWFHHGKTHREDGPAIIYRDGKVEYYLNGSLVTEDFFESFKEKLALSKELNTELEKKEPIIENLKMKL